MEKSIIIAGGGIAGLVAARQLSAHYKVTLLEAANHIGGRIYTVHREDFGGIIEYGPEFIHGEATHTFSLLKEAGMEYEELTGKMMRSREGKLYEDNEPIDGWDKLLKEMKAVTDETTLHQFLNDHFSDERYRQLRVQAKAYAEGFDLADINEVTVRSLYREWSGDETIYRIKKGYGALADYLHRQCIQNGVQILTAHTVNAVEWRKGSVRIACSNGQQFFADKLLMTIPVSQLKQDKIRYIPAIDTSPAKAIGWGHVVKVLLSFNEIFWQPDISFIFSDQLIPTWWTMLPDTRPVWMGWVGGTAAKELSIQADDALLQHALASLGNILHMPADDLRARLKAHKVMNWQHMPYIGGGYTYAMPGTDDSRNTLKEGIDDTIFFAGEGIYTGGFSGTIEAAIISAKEACGRILGSL